ncbi:MAG TPA: 2-oxoglutarate dehydrogenase E1 component [Thermodesulfobacteriota bacterium]|nr:2-oxoglutarate dehydrogenase E1 component [Thermodesulfobacteriota bacterium]
MRDVEPLPNSLSLAFVEGLYADFLRDPASVPPDWRRYFERLSEGGPAGWRPGPSFRPFSLFNPPAAVATDGAAAAPGDGAAAVVAPGRAVDARVEQLIHAYRTRGHMIAQLDPLGMPRPVPPELDPAYYGFTEADLLRPFPNNSLSGPPAVTLADILARLRNTYCRSVGVQYMHIDDPAVRLWLQERMEGTENRSPLTPAEQVRILTRLTDAVIFEEFVQKKFLGAKSFSLEGSETLIPLLDLAIEEAGAQGVREIVLAMAHRGRLNVLANIMGKSPRAIFREFEDAEPHLLPGGGDVKYHLGHSTDWTTASGRRVHLTLCFNPSHLEFINPVALGRVRAKQDRSGDTERSHVLALLVHGDAAFAGEGIVQETLNLSQLAAYRVGGALHVIVNNQLGFTVPPAEARSSTYATDVAMMLQVPIFHVNGEDPEAVAHVVRLALDFRRTFRRDVFIDMYCYRRRGHNETDEPSFTQPLLYREIERRQSVREGYLAHLLRLGGVTREEADRIAAARREELEQELSAARRESLPLSDSLGGIWSSYQGGPERTAPEVETGMDRGRLAALLEALTRLPDDFHPHPKLVRWLEQRREMARGARPVDWSAAEALAFASLAVQGVRIRMTGQDTPRGTFSQRHAVLHDVENGRTYVPLRHVSPSQAPVEICNSPLSEAGVLGFEYGYSLDCPDGLVIWEAQFGDFCNVAQPIIDQFLVSAETKWRRLSGLVLLLPHGFEGMGPEHSSARLERFLALAAEDNIQIVQPSTPAQYFHLLRRQVLRRWRKPLVVLTPKSLLRHPRVVSTLDELAEGAFRRILPDPRPAGRVERILLCSGKIYYELDEWRERTGRHDVAIVRIEQFYPLPERALAEALAPYPEGTPVRWVQEEPENMGAWHYLRVRFGDRLLGRHPFSGVTRPESASPATGSASRHALEQRTLLERAFA